MSTGSILLIELDESVLSRYGLNELTSEGFNALRDQAYQLHVPADQIAVPAGIPLYWIMELPIRSRVRTAIRRIIASRGSEKPLDEPMSYQEFLQLPGVGKLVLVELQCVLETAEVGHILSDYPDTNTEAIEAIDSAEDQSSMDKVVGDAIRSVSILGHHTRLFAAWALAETDAKTLGDAISRIQAGRPSVREWENLAKLKLEQITKKDRHPCTILDAWVENLPKRDKSIFRYRIAKIAGKRTLHKLGKEFGSTRERIRQVENRIIKKFDEFMTGPETQPIRWRVESIRRMLGNVSPSSRAEPLLLDEDGKTNYRSLLLDLAGPYDNKNGWLNLRAAAAKDPTTLIYEKCDEFGRIDPDLAGRELSSWGLDQSLHVEWLTRNKKVRIFKGQLVLWGASIGDRLAFSLSDLDHPATVDTLMQYVEELGTKKSALNALKGDPRISRVSPGEWALASWGLPIYSGIAVSIRQLLEQVNRPMLVREVVARLHSVFGLADNSVRAYCKAPMFIHKNGSIRLRTDNEPYEYPKNSLRTSPGVFFLGPHRVAIMLEVNQNLLRGSGRPLPNAAGAILGLKVGEQMTFRTKDNELVTIIFLRSSVTGPALGSVRSIAKRISSKKGHRMTLVLDSSDMSASAITTDPSQIHASWKFVERLTGIKASRGMNGLAQALRCARDEVHAILQSRGDDTVIKALPKKRVSKK